MNLPYYVATPTKAESTHRWKARKAGVEITADAVEQPGFYTTVIRRHGRPGWVFRFEVYDQTCVDILHNLNSFSSAPAAALEEELAA